MGITLQQPFTRVRLPRVTPASKPPMAVAALAAFEKMQRREGELRRKYWWILAGGLGIILALFVAVPATIGCIVHRLPNHSAAPGPAPSDDPLLFAVWLDCFLLIVAFPIALLTRKESRADVAEQLLDAGSRNAGANDNPLLRWVVVLLFLGFLYGEFLVLDAMKRMWINARLHRVDHHRAAMILARLLSEPIGIDPRMLLQHGESPLHLRQVLAYLIANEWADISPHGDFMTLVSPARRALRGYSVHAG